MKKSKYRWFIVALLYSLFMWVYAVPFYFHHRKFAFLSVDLNLLFASILAIFEMFFLVLILILLFNRLYNFLKNGR